MEERNSPAPLPLLAAKEDCSAEQAGDVAAWSPNAEARTGDIVVLMNGV